MNDVLAYALLLAHGDPDTTAGIRSLMDDPDALGEALDEPTPATESVEQPDPEADDVTDAGLVAMAMLKAKITGDDDLIDQLAAFGDDPDGLQSLLDDLAIAAAPKEEAEGPGRTPPRPGLVWKDATKRWVRDPEAGVAKKSKGGADTPKPPTKAQQAQAAKATKAANMATAKAAVTAALADPSSVQPDQLPQLAGHLKTMSVAELKTHLQGVKGKVSGTKVQLVDRLIEHVAVESQAGTRDNLPGQDQLRGVKSQRYRAGDKDTAHGAGIRTVEIGGQRYFFKALDPVSAATEAIAADAARLAGTKTPSAAVRVVGGRRGVLSSFVNGQPLSKLEPGDQRIDPAQLDRQMVFDFLTADGDRHAGNYLLDADNNLVSIDNEQHFPPGDGYGGHEIGVMAMEANALARFRTDQSRPFDADMIRQVADAGQKVARRLRAQRFSAEAQGVEDRVASLRRWADSSDRTLSSLLGQTAG